MNDDDIIALYNKRSEQAISETAVKYGAICHSVAFGILHSDEDAEECVNDVYLAVWDTIPPEHPTSFRAFISKITRNRAVSRLRRATAERRGGTQYELLLGELSECIPAGGGDMTDNLALSQAMNGFLSSLDPTMRMVFMRRYWYMKSIKQIARDYKLTEVNVRVLLHRARGKLKKCLTDEGIIL